MKYKLNKKRIIIASILLLVIVGLFSIGGHKIYKSITQNAKDYNESSTTPEYYRVTYKL